MSNIDFSTKYWEKRKEELLKFCKKDPKIVLDLVPTFSERLETMSSDFYILNYYGLGLSYAKCAKNFYIIKGDVENCKKNFFLAAKAIEMCCTLYNQGLSVKSDIAYEIENRDYLLSYSLCALIAEDEELALELCGRNSLLGCIVLQDYEKGIYYYDKEEKDSIVSTMLWNIAKGDEKQFTKNMISYIKMIRKEYRIAVNLLNEFGLGLLKLARKNHIFCDISVAELPQEILDVKIPIDYENWKLPGIDF